MPDDIDKTAIENAINKFTEDHKPAEIVEFAEWLQGLAIDIRDEFEED